MTDTNTGTDVFGICALVGAIFIVIYKFVYLPMAKDINNFVEFISSVNWNKVFIITGLIILFVFIVVFSIIHYIKKKRKLAEEKESEERRLNELKQELLKITSEEFSKYNYWNTPEEINERLGKAKVFLKQIPKEIYEQNKKVINEFFKRGYYALAEIEGIRKAKKAKEQREKEREIREKREQEMIIDELTDFKISKNSINAVPIGRKYSEEVKERAKINARCYFEEIKREKEVRKAAIEYYNKNDIDTLPDYDTCRSYYNDDEDFSYRENFDRNIFLEVRKEIKEGKIKPKNLDFSGGKVEKEFYRAEGLMEDIKVRLIPQGFKFVNGVDLDGKVCAGFYIKKTADKETDRHFCLKHLFAEINQQTKIEYCIENKRADVTYIHKELKIAIEIETGTNKEKQLMEKIEWLNKHFIYWIIVCTRDFIPKYSKYVDNKKSFCLTPKKAKEKFREFIGLVKQR